MTRIGLAGAMLATLELLAGCAMEPSDTGGPAARAPEQIKTSVAPASDPVCSPACGPASCCLLIPDIFGVPRPTCIIDAHCGSGAQENQCGTIATFCHGVLECGACPGGQ